MKSTASGGECQPSDAHNSQWLPDCEPSPAPFPKALARSLVTLQTPLNCPLRTSSAMTETGAHKAASTARKLKHAANLAHTASVGREWDWDGTGGL